MREFFPKGFRGVFLLLIALGVALAACADDKKQSTLVQNILPTKYKEEILQTFKQIVSQTTTVRDAAITDPMLNQTGPVRVYYVCVRADAHDAYHPSTGVKQYAAYFYNGHLGQFVDAPAGLCDKVSYRAFPELEKLCLGKKCK